MNEVIGEMPNQKGDDVSKIQARFATRMKLTSADVAEVIRRRLLLKNDDGIDRLTDVYVREQNNFKTLFDFADGLQSYRNFRYRDEFHSLPTRSCPTSLRFSSLRSATCRSTTPSKAAIARWVNAPCWPSSSRWPSRSPNGRWENWRPST